MITVSNKERDTDKNTMFILEKKFSSRMSLSE